MFSTITFMSFCANFNFVVRGVFSLLNGISLVHHSDSPVSPHGCSLCIICWTFYLIHYSNCIHFILLTVTVLSPWTPVGLYFCFVLLGWLCFNLPTILQRSPWSRDTFFAPKAVVFGVSKEGRRYFPNYIYLKGITHQILPAQGWVAI